MKFLGRILISISLLSFAVIGFGGCETPHSGRNYAFSTRAVPLEPEWIRNGEPVEFEGELWFPADSVENLLDTEVYQVGEYKGVPIFIELTDVRPYDRIYTRFAKHKFRFFEKKG